MLNEGSKLLIDFIENSFLKELISDSLITDVSFNGEAIFYQHNNYGRRRSEIEINCDQVHDFLRHIANLGEKQFSYSNPLLDLSFGRFRLNAVHYSLGRFNNNKTSTFSLRLASITPRISLDGSFMPTEVAKLLEILVKNKQSIVIGGPTGSGKTELQKYLISLIPDYSRIIIIDNVQELGYAANNEHLDITNWLVNEHITFGSFQELIRNSLRSHPDWLIIAESRGREMIDVLNAAMTGHPVITTIHAKSVENIPNRMVRMILMNGQETRYEEAQQDILDHFKFYIYINKGISHEGKIMRYIDTMAEIDAQNRKMNIIYEQKNNHPRFSELSPATKALISRAIIEPDLGGFFKL